MSSSAESLIHKWLRQNTQHYAQKDTVYSHVDAVIARFSSIRPKTDVYTFDDGRTQLLLCLHGLLPISYRGAAYNIPIAVWLTREYPRLPPIAYVVPTSDMLVRPSKHIDLSGRCQIDYVLNWKRKYEGCNLAALLEAMQEHFSREPPVYAKPKGRGDDSSLPQPSPAARTHSVGPDYTARPPPPLPGTHTSPAPAPTPPLTQPAPALTTSRGSNDDRPQLPVKPGASSSAPHGVSPLAVAHALPSDRMQSPAALASPYATRPPPLPPAPPTDAGLPQYRPSTMPPQYGAHEHAPSVPTTTSPSRPPPPPINHASHPSQPSIAWSPNAGTGPPVEPRYASPAQGVSPSVVSASANANANTPMYTAYSAPPVPPQPPRPPMPPHPSAGATPTMAGTVPRITQPQPQAYRANMPPPFIAQQGIGGGQAYSAASPPTIAHTTITAATTSAMGAPPPPAPPLPPTSTAPASTLRPPPSIPPPNLLDAQDDPALPNNNSNNNNRPSHPSSPSPPSRASLPAPPRPPNPELLRLHTALHAKLTSELASLRHAMALDAERLRTHQADLLAGEPAVRDEMARLEAVRDVCRSVAARVGGVVREAEVRVAELRKRGEVDVDEMVCSTTIVHNQLINLVAEDNAIEDTMYHLHRALNAGRIDLERFLRTTRVLAEEQFMKRALIEKILAGIPMGESALVLGRGVRPAWS